MAKSFLLFRPISEAIVAGEEADNEHGGGEEKVGHAPDQTSCVSGVIREALHHNRSDPSLVSRAISAEKLSVGFLIFISKTSQD